MLLISVSTFTSLCMEGIFALPLVKVCILYYVDGDTDMKECGQTVSERPSSASDYYCLSWDPPLTQESGGSCVVGRWTVDSCNIICCSMTVQLREFKKTPLYRNTLPVPTRRKNW